MIKTAIATAPPPRESMNLVEAYQIMLSAISSPASSRLTKKDLITAVLEDCTAEEKSALHDDSCYYYESREGPYGYLVSRAIEVGAITYDPERGYILGLRAPAYMT